MSSLFNPFRIFVLMSSAWVACAAAQPAGPGAASFDAEVAQVARRQLLDQTLAAGLADPQVAVSVVGERGSQTRCAGPLRVAPIDTRHPTRMRFTATCADQAPVEFVVRATVSARVVVAAGDIESGRPIAAEDLALERRTLYAGAEPLAQTSDAVGLASRRALRAGRIVDKRWLVEPMLVRRGAAVRIVARRGAIEVSSAGEALESGRRGELIKVRNAQTGSVVQARVMAESLVEPMGIP